jgi:ABC-type nitrate/sulfonate/bicarbonate transport system ATPase subunit
VATRQAPLMSQMTDASPGVVPGQDGDLAVELLNVSVAFRSAGQPVVALDDVSLSIRQGEFVAIVGPSGCGKTTILNLLAGLMNPTRGAVLRHGRPVAGPSRDVGYMLARSALIPWRTVRRNVELGPELRHAPRRTRRAQAMELLSTVGLQDFAGMFPAQLSHGMQQRAAVARTLAIDPDLWLMDEPFGALDAQTRQSVQTEFLRIWGSDPRTVIFVTHDLSEAVLMADRVIVMSPRPGRIRVDTRIDLPRPRDLVTLRFDARYVEYEREIWRRLHND